MTGGAPSGVVTFLFTDLRVRPVGGRKTLMDAGGARRPSRGAALGDRGARGLVVQAHR